MSKIIIHNESLPDSVAISCVARVIADGMVSESRGHKQYCFVTTFTETATGLENVVIASRNGDTHTFKVRAKTPLSDTSLQ